MKSTVDRESLRTRVILYVFGSEPPTTYKSPTANIAARKGLNSISHETLGHTWLLVHRSAGKQLVNYNRMLRRAKLGKERKNCELLRLQALYGQLTLCAGRALGAPLLVTRK